MSPEAPRALVSFDPNHPNAADLVIALKAKFGADCADSGIAGSVVITLRANAPDADAFWIMEEFVGQSCPGLIGYPKLYR